MTTTLPNPIWPYDKTADVQLEAAAGSGAKFAAQHFPAVPCKVIDTKGEQDEA